MPRDFEAVFGIRIVSDVLTKHVLESVDPDGFALAACDFMPADGSPGAQYHLCDVIRRIDQGRSRMRIDYGRDHDTGEGIKLYGLSGGAGRSFRPDIVGDAHIFRRPRLPAGPIRDPVMADVPTTATLDDVRLRDAADFRAGGGAAAKEPI